MRKRKAEADGMEDRMRLQITPEMESSPERLSASGNDSTDSADLNCNRSKSGGQTLLAATLESVRRKLESSNSPLHLHVDNPIEVVFPKETRKLRAVYIKNLVVLSIGSMLVLTPFHSLKNLQSTINNDDGLGLISLAVLSVLFAVGCCSALFLINYFHIKWVVVTAVAANFLYVVSNFYTNFYILLPASAFLGYTLAGLWTAQVSYIASLSFAFSVVAGKSHDSILQLFTSFFILTTRLAQVLGNLLSSIVFNIQSSAFAEYERYFAVTVPGQTGKVDDSGLDAAVCKDNEHCTREMYDSIAANNNGGVSLERVYSLLSIFAIIICLGGLALIFFLDKLDVIFHKQTFSAVKQAQTFLACHKNKTTLLLLPLMLYLGILEAFICGEFTKYYVTCSVGLRVIGYVMMVFACCEIFSSFVSVRLQRNMDGIYIITTGALCNIGLLVYMFLRPPPEKEILLVYSLAAVFGLVNGILQTESAYMCGRFFPQNRDVAFTVLYVYKSLGCAAAFAYAPFLCLDWKLVILSAMFLLAWLAYYALELMRRLTRSTRSSEAAI